LTTHIVHIFLFAFLFTTLSHNGLCTPPDGSSSSSPSSPSSSAGPLLAPDASQDLEPLFLNYPSNLHQGAKTAGGILLSVAGGVVGFLTAGGATYYFTDNSDLAGAIGGTVFASISLGGSAYNIWNWRKGQVLGGDIPNGDEEVYLVQIKDGLAQIDAASESGIESQPVWDAFNPWLDSLMVIESSESGIVIQRREGDNVSAKTWTTSDPDKVKTFVEGLLEFAHNELSHNPRCNFPSGTGSQWTPFVNVHRALLPASAEPHVGSLED